MIQIYLRDIFNGFPPVLTLGKEEYRDVAGGYVITRDGSDFYIPDSNIRAVQTTKGKFV